VRLSIGCLDCL